MTLREQIYHFGSLDIHAAIAMQKAIDLRKMEMTSTEDKTLQKADKAVRAVIDELDQLYDDLDRHISATVRNQEYAEQGKGL